MFLGFHRLIAVISLLSVSRGLSRWAAWGKFVTWKPNLEKSLLWECHETTSETELMHVCIIFKNVCFNLICISLFLVMLAWLPPTMTQSNNNTTMNKSTCPLHFNHSTITSLDCIQWAVDPKTPSFGLVTIWTSCVFDKLPKSLLLLCMEYYLNYWEQLAPSSGLGALVCEVCMFLLCLDVWLALVLSALIRLMAN